MDDGDLLARHLRHDEIGRHFALLIVAPAGAEHVPQLALGECGVGGGRRDLQDAVLVVDLGRGDRDAGIIIADHEFDPVADEFVGDGHALLGIGNVVANAHGELLPENAAGGVDVRDGLLDAVLHLCAGGRAWAGDGTGHADLHLRLGCARKTKARRKDKA